MDGGGYQSEDDKDDLKHWARSSLFSLHAHFIAIRESDRA
jgi:hypothetical protein